MREVPAAALGKIVRVPRLTFHRSGQAITGVGPSKTPRDVTSASDGAQGKKAELLRTGVPSHQKHGKTCVGSESSPSVEASSDLPPNHACIGWSRCINLSGTGVCYSDGVVCMAAVGGSMCCRTRPSTCDQRRGSHWLCKWLGVNTRLNHEPPWQCTGCF